MELSPSSHGQRLDKALSLELPDYSRSFLQDLIKQGSVTMAGEAVSQRHRVVGGELLEVLLPEPEDHELQGEDIALDIRYEDDDLLVINKPAGLVVHPGAGNPTGTVMNAMLFHAPQVVSLPRAGIVHRLDKDTSGLMVVAKTEGARQRLIEALQEREISRQYQTIVHGQVISGGTVDAPIGRHRVNRIKMAVTHSGKPAVSHYRVLQRFGDHTLLQVSLESGRTHQIRVHMAHIGFPVVGDPLYGGRPKVPAGITEQSRQQFLSFSRQALHACQLELLHPASGEQMSFKSDPPKDFLELVELLENFSSSDDEWVSISSRPTRFSRL